LDPGSELTMGVLDEPSVRTPWFVDGPRVRLADGQEWSLPLREPYGDDLEYDSLLALVTGSEDHAETLRAELALSIFLLTRNYELSPEALDSILRFASDDPDLNALQRAVHEVACESFRRGQTARSRPGTTPHTARGVDEVTPTLRK
jgi:hypothetical protein